MKPTRFQFCLAVALLLSATGLSFADEADYRLTPLPSGSLAASAVGANPSVSPSVSPAKSHPLRTVASSLAIVLGGFAILTAVFRKMEKPRAKPSDLMETLGAVQVTSKVKLHLVRLGSRILVLHLGTNSVERVAEITDPVEVEQLLRGGDVTDAVNVPQVDEMLRAVNSSGASV